MEAARPRKPLVAYGVKGIWYSVTHGEKPGAALTATAPSSRGSLSILLFEITKTLNDSVLDQGKHLSHTNGTLVIH